MTPRRILVRWSPALLALVALLPMQGGLVATGHVVLALDEPAPRAPEDAALAAPGGVSDPVRPPARADRDARDDDAGALEATAAPAPEPAAAPAASPPSPSFPEPPFVAPEPEAPTEPAAASSSRGSPLGVRLALRASLSL